MTQGHGRKVTLLLVYSLFVINRGVLIVGCQFRPSCRLPMIPRAPPWEELETFATAVVHRKACDRVTV